MANTKNQSFAGNLLFDQDNIYNIGASAASRPANIYAATAMFAAGSAVLTVANFNANAFPLRAPNGTTTAPSYSFSAETGLGLYRIGTNDYALTGWNGNTAAYENAIEINGSNVVLNMMKATGANGRLYFGTIASGPQIFSGNTDTRLTLQASGSGGDIRLYAAGSALSGLFSSTTVEIYQNLIMQDKNITFVTDGTGNIGALGANRPDNVYAKTSLSANGTKMTGNSAGNSVTFSDESGANTIFRCITDNQFLIVGSTTDLIWNTDGGGTIGRSGTLRPDKAFIKTSITVPLLTGLSAPVNASDAANKAYVDSIASGLDLKASVRVATTAALPSVTYANGTGGVGATLTATANGSINPIDGVTLVVGNRILVKNQAAGLQNGIYTVTQLGDGSNPFILTRSTDADDNSGTFPEITSGMYTFVEEGTVNAGFSYILTTVNPITIGTTALVFGIFSNTGGGANKSLSNLASVAINTDLVPGVDNTIDLGASALRFRTLYLGTSIRNADGAPGLPSYAFGAHTTTGFFWDNSVITASGGIAIAHAGVEKLAFGANNNAFDISFASGITASLIWGGGGATSYITGTSGTGSLQVVSNGVVTITSHIASGNGILLSADSGSGNQFIVQTAGVLVNQVDLKIASANLLYSTDGNGNIGASGANRPLNAYVKQNVLVGTSTAAVAFTNATQSSVQVGSINYSADSIVCMMGTAIVSADAYIGYRHKGAAYDVFQGFVMNQNSTGFGGTGWNMELIRQNIASPSSIDLLYFNNPSSNTLNLLWGGDGTGSIGDVAHTGRPTNAYVKTLIDCGGNISLSGNLLFNNDSTNDIGANGANRPNIIWVGGTIRNVAGSAAGPTYTFSSGGANDGMYWATGPILGFATSNTNRLSISSASIAATVPFFAPNGGAAAPSYSFTSSTGTGMYSSAANTIDFATNGVARVQITSVGHLFVDNVGTANNSAVRIRSTNSTNGCSLSLEDNDGAGGVGTSTITGYAGSIYFSKEATYGGSRSAMFLMGNNGAFHVQQNAGSIEFEGVTTGNNILVWNDGTERASNTIGLASSRRPGFIYAAFGVGVNLTAAQNAKAILQLDSTTQGVLLPRMTTTQIGAITSVPEGLLLYDNVLHAYYFYNGTAFTAMGGGGDPFPTTSPTTNSLFTGGPANGGMTGLRNTVYGIGALPVATTAATTTAVGYRAALNLTTGDGTFIGDMAGQGATTAGQLVVIGESATLGAGTGPSESVVIGNSAGSSSLTGQGSILIGYGAGQNITSGKYNIAIGDLTSFTGIATGTGNGNILIGAGAHVYTANDSGKIIFGSSTASASTNTMLLGQGGDHVAGASLTSFTITVTPAFGTDQSAATGILSIAGSQGTGTGVGGAISFKTAPAGSTGSSLNTLVESWRIDTNGKLLSPNNNQIGDFSGSINPEFIFLKNTGAIQIGDSSGGVWGQSINTVASGNNNAIRFYAASLYSGVSISYNIASISVGDTTGANINQITGLLVGLGAGYTGSNARAIYAYNQCAQAATSISFDNIHGSIALYGAASGTGQINIPVMGVGYNGVVSTGAMFAAGNDATASHRSIGMASYAWQTGAGGNNIAGYFLLKDPLGNGNVAYFFPASAQVNAAIVADNGSSGFDIANFFAAGVSKVRIDGTGHIVAAVGSTGLPSYTFAGNTTTGFWVDGSGNIQVSLGSTEWFYFHNAGSYGSIVNPGSPSDSYIRFSVNGRMEYNSHTQEEHYVNGTGVFFLQPTKILSEVDLIMDNGIGATNIKWTADGGGDIGASGASRPGNIYALSNINLASLSASSVVVSDASKNLVSSAVSSASLGYLTNNEALQSFTLADNVAANAAITGASWPIASFTSIQLKYSINRNGNLESGIILIITDGTSVDVDKMEAILGSTGITFDADISGGNLRLLYTSTSTGSTGTFKWKVDKWLA